jgi:hypothetical protein
MSASNDNKGDKKKPQDAPPEPTGSDKKSGRVAFDSKGNPIWEWQLETGVFSRDVNTQKLKKLDLGDLSIADSGVHPQPAGRGSQAQPSAPTPTKPARPQSGGKPQSSGKGGDFNPYDSGSTGSGNRNLGTGSGFNPYDSSGRPAPGSGTNPYDRARALGNRFNPDPPAPEQRRRTPADLRKLDEEIKAQRKKRKE